MAEVVRPHHMQNEVATNRPEYRDPRWERAVKVFTINQESKYLIVLNVPALGIIKELLAIFHVYGEIEEYKLLDEYPCEPYTDVYFIKYKQIDSARAAKRKLDNWYFFSRRLHVCYAPEYEVLSETREKLMQRQEVIANKTRDSIILHEQQRRLVSSVPSRPNQLVPEHSVFPYVTNLIPSPPPPRAPYPHHNIPRVSLQHQIPPPAPFPSCMPHSGPLPNRMPLSGPFPHHIPPSGPFPHHIPPSGPFPHHIPPSGPFPHHIPPSGPFPHHIPPSGPFPHHTLPSIPQNHPMNKYAFPHSQQFHPRHIRPRLPIAPSPTRLSPSPHSIVLNKPPPPIDNQKPPPLISDHTHRPLSCPPPLVSDPPFTKPLPPPPLLSTSHTTRTIAITNTPCKLSTEESVRMHLEEKDMCTVIEQPVHAAKHVRGQSAGNDGHAGVVSLPQQPNVIHVQVHDGQSHDRNVNHIVYRDDHGNNLDGSKMFQDKMAVNDSIQSGNQSVDNTVMTIRHRISQIFKPPPELEEFKPEVKKRRKI